MTAEPDKERVAAVSVKSGLFVLRYVAAGKGLPPWVYAQVSPSSVESVELVFVPGKPKGVLDEPDSYAIIAADQPGQLQLTLVPHVGGEANARIQIAPLKLDFGGSAEERSAGNMRSDRDGADRSVIEQNGVVGQVQPDGLGHAATSSEMSSFSLRCHLAKRGDVEAIANRWVGGPDAPAAIEGLSIDWSAPPGVYLEYQVIAHGADGRWSNWVRAGGFAGSRGRSLPLVGVRLRVSGAASAPFSLAGEALFLGSSLIADAGREIEFVSDTGLDPLVGLRLRLDVPDGVLFSSRNSCAIREEVAARGSLRVFKSSRFLESLPDQQTL